MKIGEYINNYLTDHQISRRQFAQSVGVSPAYISMLINGENSSTGKPIMPSYPVIAKIAKCIGISIDELITSVDDFEIYLPASTPTAEDYSSIGVASRIVPSKDEMPRKTALDKIIDQLTEYRDALPYGLRPDEEKLLQDYRMLDTKQRVKLRKLIDLMLDDE